MSSKPKSDGWKPRDWATLARDISEEDALAKLLELKLARKGKLRLRRVAAGFMSQPQSISGRA